MGNSCCNTVKQELKINYEGIRLNEDCINKKRNKLGFHNNTEEIEFQAQVRNFNALDKEKIMFLSNTSAKQSSDCCNEGSTNYKSINLLNEKQERANSQKVDIKPSVSFDEKEKQGLNIISRINNLTIYKSLSKGSITHKPAYLQITNPKLMLTHISYEQASLNLDEFQPSKSNLISKVSNEERKTSGRNINELLRNISVSCWSLILNFLDQPDLMRAGKSCSLFNKLAISPQIFKKFYHSPARQTQTEGISVAQFTQIYSKTKPKQSFLSPIRDKEIKCTITPRHTKKVEIHKNFQCSSPTSLYMSPTRINVKRFSVCIETGPNNLELLTKNIKPTTKPYIYSGSISDLNFSHSILSNKIDKTNAKDSPEDELNFSLY